MVTSSAPASRAKTHPSATININSRLMIILFHSERHEHQIHPRRDFLAPSENMKVAVSASGDQAATLAPMSMLHRPWYLHFLSIFPSEV